MVADRGLNSNENLVKLLDMGCDFVIAQKIKNLGKDMAEKVRSDDWQGMHIDTQSGEVLYKWRKMAVDKPLYETKINPVTGKRSSNNNKEIGDLPVT